MGTKKLVRVRVFATAARTALGAVFPHGLGCRGSAWGFNGSMTDRQILALREALCIVLWAVSVLCASLAAATGIARNQPPGLGSDVQRSMYFEAPILPRAVQGEQHHEKHWSMKMLILILMIDD